MRGTTHHSQDRIGGRQRPGDPALQAGTGPDELRVGADTRGVEDEVFVVEPHRVHAGDVPGADRADGGSGGVAADVAGEVVEGAGREHREGQIGRAGDCGRCRDGPVTTGDTEYLGVGRRITQDLLDVGVLIEFDDLGRRQIAAYAVKHARALTVTRVWIDHHHNTITVWPGLGVYS